MHCLLICMINRINVRRILEGNGHNKYILTIILPV